MQCIFYEVVLLPAIQLLQSKVMGCVLISFKSDKYFSLSVEFIKWRNVLVYY